MLGVKFTIQHLNGNQITIKTDGIISDDDIRIIPNMGLPNMNNPSDMGNLLIKFNVNKKIQLDATKIKLIKQIFPPDGFLINKKAEIFDAITPEQYQTAASTSQFEQSDNGEGVQCAQQ